MRIYQDGSLRIEYPEDIIFVFNPQRIVVEGGGEYCEFVISDGTHTIHDAREPYGGKVLIDFATYAQECFEKGERHKNITIDVLTDNGEVRFSFKAVWGALNIGEIWNEERVVRWWKNYPQTFGVYVPAGATVEKREDGGYSACSVGSGFLDLSLASLFPTAQRSAGLRVSGGGQIGVFDYTFDYTFGSVTSEGGTQIWLFDINECDTGIFLRWVDRHGWLQYWLLKDGEETQSASNEGDEVSVEYADDVQSYHYGVTRQSKSLSKTMKGCAVLLNEKEREIVSGVAGSPYVDWWNGNAWVPVRIANGTFVNDKSGLVDYEVEIILPKIVTQTL